MNPHEASAAWSHVILTSHPQEALPRSCFGSDSHMCSQWRRDDICNETKIKVNHRRGGATCVPAENDIQHMEIYGRSLSGAEKSGTRLQQVKAAGGKCAASLECQPKLSEGNENIYIKSQSL